MNKANNSSGNRSSNARKHKKNALAKTNPRFGDLAQHIIDPGHVKPALAPSLCPSRAGAVTFPIIVDVTGLTDYCVVVQPDISRPLMITHEGAIPETAGTWSGFFDKQFDGPDCDLTADRGCHIESTLVASRPAIPLSSAAGCTISLSANITEGDAAYYDIDAFYYNGVSWVPIGSQPVAVGQGGVVLAAGFAYPSTATHISIQATQLGVISFNGETTPGTCHGAYNLQVTSGSATCSTGTNGSENVFDVYMPEWDKILSVADKVSIPYMDALVTYQGSTLANQGAIAVAACSEELQPLNGSYYQRVASRPFDSYEGRLASQGETDGGGHWHLLHDDIRAYSLSRSEELITGPRGYFAIKGMDPTQTTRVMVHLTLNYYTIDPAFNMSFQPPWGEMDLLLYTLRTQVPLVSSNDSHLDKLIALAKKKAAQAATWALNNPEEAAAMAFAAAEIVGSALV